MATSCGEFSNQSHDSTDFKALLAGLLAELHHCIVSAHDVALAQSYAPSGSVIVDKISSDSQRLEFIDWLRGARRLIDTDSFLKQTHSPPPPPFLLPPREKQGDTLPEEPGCAAYAKCSPCEQLELKQASPSPILHKMQRTPQNHEDTSPMHGSTLLEWQGQRSHGLAIPLGSYEASDADFESQGTGKVEAQDPEIINLKRSFASTWTPLEPRRRMSESSFIPERHTALARLQACLGFEDISLNILKFVRIARLGRLVLTFRLKFLQRAHAAGQRTSH